MGHAKSHRHLATAVEIVAAPLSFLLYRATRFVVQRLVQLDSRRHAALATSWRTLDAAAVAKPFNLLALMTSAPRWNTHAVISLAGPLRVRHTIRIHTATAAKSAASWTIVVHAEPAHRIVASIGSLDTTSDDPWQSLHLPSGSYRLALRYYRCAEPTILPAIEVDGEPTVEVVTIAADTNDFYHDLSTGNRFFYTCLHSYVCTLLRYRRRFPPSFVAREYLPAGNPQTTFRYGFMPAGTGLDVDLDAAVLRTHDIYCTTYDRASFPTTWAQLTETHNRTPHTSVDGSYLIRIHAKSPNQQSCEPDQVRIRMRPAAPDQARAR